MPKRKILLTQEAIYDIVDISCYIEAKFGLPRADHFQQDIQEQLQLLSDMGGAFSKTQLFYRGWQIYKKVFSPSIIFYIINEPEIHILRVLRGESDWQTKLKQQHYTY